MDLETLLGKIEAAPLGTPELDSEFASVYGKRWKVLGNISAGGQGVIFRVTDQSQELEGEWALKRLVRKDRLDRFQREVEILRRLRHENIIKLERIPVMWKRSLHVGSNWRILAD